MKSDLETRLPAEENTLILHRSEGKRRERDRGRKKEIASSRSLALFVPIRHKGKPATFHRRFTCTCRPRTELSPRGGRQGGVIEQSYVQLLLGARFHRSLSSLARRYRNSKCVAEIRGRGLDRKMERRTTKRGEIRTGQGEARLARNKEGRDDEEGAKCLDKE